MLRLWPSSLRGRLLLLVGLTILPVMGLLIVGHVERRTAETTTIRGNALNFARLAAQAQTRRLEGARQFLIALSAASDVRSGDPDRCRAYVQLLAHQHRDTYTDIGVADASGNVICHALPDSGSMKIGDRPYFTRAIATRNFAVGDYMVGRVSGRSAVGFSYPLIEKSGAIAGVLFANIDLHRISASLQSDLGAPDATLSVLDRSGTILARSVDADNWIGVKATADQTRIMAERGELVADFTGPDRIPRVYAVATVHDHENTPAWFVAVGMRRDVAMGKADRRLWRDLGVVALVGILVLTAAFAGAEVLIRRPVTQLSQATAALAAGDLQTRAHEVSGVTELVDLGRAFNQMAERLQQRDLHLRQGQRLEAIGQLAGGIAHDFNNLLTVIIGYGESMRDRMPPGGEGDAEAAELLGAAERAAKLTRQLLAFSRRQTLQPKPVNLNDVVAHMHAMLTRLIGEHVQLVTALAGDLAIVQADRAQLEQVILNLVINARDAMADGGTVTIDSFNREIGPDEVRVSSDYGAIPPGSYVVLRVTDTGAGMDEETRARAFEPFFSTKGTQGTGLGLSTVYGIVKQSGGFIGLESEKGRGTRVLIYLPQSTATAPQPAATAERQPPGGTERIVLVEDETGVRSLVQSVLAHHGYQVRSTNDPIEALDWIRQDPAAVDLLVSDVVMPHMSGPALADAVRRIRPGLPVLFMSGYANDPANRMTVPSTAPFVQKPFTRSFLLERIRELLDGASHPTRTVSSI
jgi:signal transduction histidine kinase